MNQNETSNELFIYKGSIPGSPADKSDLQKGDKLLSLNGITLRTIDDYIAAIKVNRNQRVVEVLRGDQILTITIEIEVEDEPVMN